MRRNLDGGQMRQTFQKRQNSRQYQGLAETRLTLPVSRQKDIVLQKIRSENIVVIAGETGSGKSTQIPQFILQVTAATAALVLDMGFSGLLVPFF